MIQDQKTNAELMQIDALLKDTDFALKVAAKQEAAYYEGIGKHAPVFISENDKVNNVERPLIDEKTAVSLAGFYAVETGIGWLCKRDELTPIESLQNIVQNKIAESDLELLSRFANATWKAGQPFRALERIQRPVFTVFDLLQEEQVAKDRNQIINAAGKLYNDIQDLAGAETAIQFQQIRSYLQSVEYAYEMASFLNKTHRERKQKPPREFIKESEKDFLLNKPVVDLKIATNVAGLYALECSLAYFVNQKKITPSNFLQLVVENKMEPQDKELMNRFANATWKASQPFRGMERITRPIFTPFYFLPDDEVDKDWTQLQTAAKQLQASLKVVD